jgi:FdhE protein
MRRATTRVREDRDPRLSRLAARDPEWRTWIALLETTLRVAAEGGWDHALSPLTDALSGRAAPLLCRHQVHVDTDRLGHLLRGLAAILPASAGLNRYDPSPLEALELVVAAVAQDWSAIGAIATRAGVPDDALATIAPLASWPLLQACGRRLAPYIPADWDHGYCPVCGAWPLLSELRGLERARRLRCGRCAADWPLPWLSCAYCGERRHERLGSLVSEGQLDGRKIETCAECRGYMKSVSTLEPLTPAGVLLTDLETVELDLVAHERAWIRPDRPACALAVQIVTAPRAAAARLW